MCLKLGRFIFEGHAAWTEATRNTWEAQVGWVGRRKQPRTAVHTAKQAAHSAAAVPLELIWLWVNTHGTILG